MPKFYHVDSLSDRIPLQIVRKEVPLSPAEKQYLLAVERGDFASVRHALEEAEIYFNININCRDPLGRTALQIAIQNENIEIIELLLRYHVHVGDALLHAIDEEVVEAVELLLNYKPPKKDLHVRILQETQESDYDSDISPVIMAAHRNNYEILKVLLERGASIPKPHDVKCGCDDCKASIRHDGLRHSRSRLNIYRALASSSLIALSSDDPVLTAFELSWELRKLSHKENEFKEEYEKLAENCREFATQLLDQTRGSHELSTILNRDEDAPSGEEALSRLRLAIKYKQKAFTAHPNCQQLLAEEWYQGLPGWRRQHWTLKVMISFFVGMSFPLLSFMYLLAPKTKLGRILRLPFIQFICHSASYLVFVVLLLMASLEFSNSTPEKSRRIDTRGPPPTDVELLIAWWIAGFVWAEIKQLWDAGIIEYLHDWWNLLDFITNSLYITVIGLRITAYVNIHILQNEAYGDKDASRDAWDMWDPTLLAEAAFAVANVLSMLRLVYLFTANSHLGPLQISLGRMVEDIVKFAFLAILVIFSFAAGLNQLYWVYSSEPVDGACTGVTCESQDHNVFSNMLTSLEALMWAIFGQLQVSVVYLGNNHDVTVFIGAVMLCTYSIITIVILLNLLIAMMNTSFQKIQTRADMEWKFARAKLWMSYFEEGNTLPSPFNTIPSPKSFYYFFRWCWKNICCCQWNQKKQATVKRVRDQTQKRKEKDEDYQRVVKNLVKRYLKYSKRGEQEKGVTEDDLNEIKQDISAFRYEMLEILKKKDPVVAPKNVKFQNGSAGGNGPGPNRKNGKSSEDENSLHRVPSYLYRKGKKGKKSPQHQDQPSIKPIKSAPIQDEDYSMPEFLKVKNVKNVVLAVNELQKKSMRRRLSQAAVLSELRAQEERRLSAASLSPETIPEVIPQWNKPPLTDSGISESIDDPPTSRKLDTVNEYSAEEEVVSGGSQEKKDADDLDDSSRRSSLSGRAPLRREKAFAARMDEEDSPPAAPQGDPNAPSPDNSADSQSTSGIASTNNSFQSQDSRDDDIDDDDEEEDDEDNDDEDDLQIHEDTATNTSEETEEEVTVERVNSSPLLGDTGAGGDQPLTDIPQLNWQSKRPSYPWTENNTQKDGIEMKRYVYNGFNNLPH